MAVACSVFARVNQSSSGREFVRRLIFCLLFAVTGICLSQEPIRVKVKLVNVAFSARDSRGVLIENLTQDDVEVFEDAVPQKISFFARSVDVPLTLGLIVDFSGSQDQFSKQHEHDLQIFLKDVLGPKDRRISDLLRQSYPARQRFLAIRHRTHGTTGTI
jgi:hypothetical protein